MAKDVSTYSLVELNVGVGFQEVLLLGLRLAKDDTLHGALVLPQ